MSMMIEQNVLNTIIHDLKAVREKILDQFEGIVFDFSEALDAKTELGDEDSRDDFIFENQILTCDKHGQPIAAYPIKLVDGTLILEDVYSGGRITADLRYLNNDDLLGILQAIVSLS